MLFTFCMLMATVSSVYGAEIVRTAYFKHPAAGGASIGEISINNQVVLRIRTEAGGFSIAQRTELVADRLKKIVAAKVDPAQIMPAVQGNDIVIKAGEKFIVTVDQGSAKANGTTTRVLGYVWANQLRQALGGSALKENPLPEPKKEVTAVYYGKAAWYGGIFQGKLTASGERFNQYDYTAAHRSLPFGTRLLVTNLNNGKNVIVRVNDRGPFIRSRIIDLSRQAAAEIGLISSGVGNVKVEVLR